MMDTRVPEEMALGEKVNRWYKIQMIAFLAGVLLFILAFLAIFGLWYGSYEKAKYENKRAKWAAEAKLWDARQAGITNAVKITAKGEK